MAQTTIAFRIDEDAKRRMEAVCRELGISMSSALTMCVYAIGRNRALPDDIVCLKGEHDTARSEISTHEKILRGMEQIRNGGGTFHELIDADDNE